MEYNKRFMKSVIDREMSLIKVLEHLEVVNRGHLAVNRSCFCPFHENTDTPAAKIYDDAEGITLFCFSEQRKYRSSDAFEIFSEFKLEQIFDKVWTKLSEESKQFYNNQMFVDNDLTDIWKESLEKLQKFKKGKISYDDVLNIILDNIEKERSK